MCARRGEKEIKYMMELIINFLMKRQPSPLLRIAS